MVERGFTDNYLKTGAIDLMKRSPVFLAVVFLALAACARYGEQGGSLRVNLGADLAATLTRASEGVGSGFYLLPASGDYDNIPQDPRNALTPARVELGKLLFHETALATRPELHLGNRTYSCASCHHAKAGFQAGIIQGIAEGGIGFGLRYLPAKLPSGNCFPNNDPKSRTDMGCR